MDREGVIKFSLHHRTEALPLALEPLARSLDAWRAVLLQTGLLGQDPSRYGGLGFGNVSAALRPQNEPARRVFMISGTQTGQHQHLTLADFSLVLDADVETNKVQSSGQTAPSSESLTHAAIYQSGLPIDYVFHAHSPDIWNAVDALDLPATAPDVPYGTPQMALAVQQLLRRAELADKGLLVMRGHEDGVVSFGRSADEAGCRLLCALVQAKTKGRPPA